MPMITPHVPDGLMDLMKGFAKQVLREKPENILAFAADHFEKLLIERDGSLHKGYEKFHFTEEDLVKREKEFIKSVINGEYKMENENSSEISKRSEKSFKSRKKSFGKSSRKPSENLIVIKEIEDEDSGNVSNSKKDSKKEDAASVIQKVFKAYLRQKRQQGHKKEVEENAAIVIQKALRSFFARNVVKKPNPTIIPSGSNSTDNVNVVSGENQEGINKNEISENQNLPVEVDESTSKKGSDNFKDLITIESSADELKEKTLNGVEGNGNEERDTRTVNVEKSDEMEKPAEISNDTNQKVDVVEPDTNIHEISRQETLPVDETLDESGNSNDGNNEGNENDNVKNSNSKIPTEENITNNRVYSKENVVPTESNTMDSGSDETRMEKDKKAWYVGEEPIVVSKSLDEESSVELDLVNKLNIKNAELKSDDVPPSDSKTDTMKEIGMKKSKTSQDLLNQNSVEFISSEPMHIGGEIKGNPVGVEVTSNAETISHENSSESDNSDTTATGTAQQEENLNENKNDNNDEEVEKVEKGNIDGTTVSTYFESESLKDIAVNKESTLIFEDDIKKDDNQTKSNKGTNDTIDLEKDRKEVFEDKCIKKIVKNKQETVPENEDENVDVVDPDKKKEDVAAEASNENREEHQDEKPTSKEIVNDKEKEEKSNEKEFDSIQEKDDNEKSSKETNEIIDEEQISNTESNVEEIKESITSDANKVDETNSLTIVKSDTDFVEQNDQVQNSENSQERAETIRNANEMLDEDVPEIANNNEAIHEKYVKNENIGSEEKLNQNFTAEKKDDKMVSKESGDDMINDLLSKESNETVINDIVKEKDNVLAEKDGKLKEQNNVEKVLEENANEIVSDTETNINVGVDSKQTTDETKLKKLGSKRSSEDEAALIIQKHYKGYQTRKVLKRGEAISEILPEITKNSPIRGNSTVEESQDIILEEKYISSTESALNISTSDDKEIDLKEQLKNENELEEIDGMNENKVEDSSIDKQNAIDDVKNIKRDSTFDLEVQTDEGSTQIDNNSEQKITLLDEENAAINIQKVYRGYRTRRDLNAIEALGPEQNLLEEDFKQNEDNSGDNVERKSNDGEKPLENDDGQHKISENDAAITIQKNFKGYKVRKDFQNKTKPLKEENSLREKDCTDDMNSEDPTDQHDSMKAKENTIEVNRKETKIESQFVELKKNTSLISLDDLEENVEGACKRDYVATGKSYSHEEKSSDNGSATKGVEIKVSKEEEKSLDTKLNEMNSNDNEKTVASKESEKIETNVEGDSSLNGKEKILPISDENASTCLVVSIKEEENFSINEPIIKKNLSLESEAVQLVEHFPKIDEDIKEDTVKDNSHSNDLLSENESSSRIALGGQVELNSIVSKNQDDTASNTSEVKEIISSEDPIKESEKDIEEKCLSIPEKNVEDLDKESSEISQVPFDEKQLANAKDQNTEGIDKTINNLKSEEQSEEILKLQENDKIQLDDLLKRSENELENSVNDDATNASESNVQIRGDEYLNKNDENKNQVVSTEDKSVSDNLKTEENEEFKQNRSEYPNSENRSIKMEETKSNVEVPNDAVEEDTVRIVDRESIEESKHEEENINKEDSISQDNNKSLEQSENSPEETQVLLNQSSSELNKSELNKENTEIELVENVKHEEGKVDKTGKSISLPEHDNVIVEKTENNQEVIGKSTSVEDGKDFDEQSQNTELFNEEVCENVDSKKMEDKTESVTKQIEEISILPINENSNIILDENVKTVKNAVSAKKSMDVKDFGENKSENEERKQSASENSSVLTESTEKCIDVEEKEPMEEPIKIEETKSENRSSEDIQSKIETLSNVEVPFDEINGSKALVELDNTDGNEIHEVTIEKEKAIKEEKSLDKSVSSCSQNERTSQEEERKTTVLETDDSNPLNENRENNAEGKSPRRIYEKQPSFVYFTKAEDNDKDSIKNTEERDNIAESSSPDRTHFKRKEKHTDKETGECLVDDFIDEASNKNHSQDDTEENVENQSNKSAFDENLTKNTINDSQNLPDEEIQTTALDNTVSAEHKSEEASFVEKPIPQGIDEKSNLVDSNLDNKSLNASQSGLSEAETTRAESRSTNRDEDLTEIDNIDIASYNEDSLEAMYYSLKKNEIMLDRMKRRASDHRRASEEKIEQSRASSLESKISTEEGASNIENENVLGELVNPFEASLGSRESYLNHLHRAASIPERTVATPDVDDENSNRKYSLYTDEMKIMNDSRTDTPTKDYPKAVSFENPVEISKRISDDFMEQMHFGTNSKDSFKAHSVDSVAKERTFHPEISSSLSKTDSDQFPEDAEEITNAISDFDINTALESIRATSTDTDSTIISAVTKIQAGARGFLTRRRLRRATISGAIVPSDIEKSTSINSRMSSPYLNDDDDDADNNLRTSMDSDASKQQENEAATKIQKTFRQHKQRRRRLQRKASSVQEIATNLNTSSASPVLMKLEHEENFYSEEKSENNKLEEKCENFENVTASPEEEKQRSSSLSLPPAAESNKTVDDNNKLENADSKNDEENMKNEDEERVTTSDEDNETKFSSGTDGQAINRGRQSGDNYEENENKNPSTSDLSAPSSGEDENPFIGGSNLAARRLTLQRGDAVQVYSAATPEEVVSPRNDGNNTDGKLTNENTSTVGEMPVDKAEKQQRRKEMMKMLAYRQRTMPVQIDSEVLRMLPKHMRKRIKSADNPRDDGKLKRRNLF